MDRSFSVVVFFSVVSAMLLAEGAHAGARVFVVPAVGANAADVEAGVRAGLGSVPDAVVAEAAEVQALVEGAKSTGLDCGADDGACWMRVAVLGGHDHVVFSSATGVTRVSAEGTATSPVLVASREGWASATRRTFGRESALRLGVTPSTAVVNLDGKPVSGPLIEGVSPGSHAVDASAPGFVSASSTLNVPAGAIVDVTLALSAEEAAGPTALQSGLLYGGLGAIGLGVVVGSILGGVGYSAGGCDLGKGTCSDKGTADTFSFAGFGVGVALGGIGVASSAASFFVQ